MTGFFELESPPTAITRNEVTSNLAIPTIATEDRFAIGKAVFIFGRRQLFTAVRISKNKNKVQSTEDLQLILVYPPPRSRGTK